MKNSKKMRLEVLKISIFFLILPRSAYAYLDPGTGSYVLQLILAGLLGAAFAVKLFWVRIKTFVASLFSKKPKDE